MLKKREKPPKHKSYTEVNNYKKMKQASGNKRVFAFCITTSRRS